MARRVKSLKPTGLDGDGYAHREHRSMRGRESRYMEKRNRRGIRAEGENKRARMQLNNAKKRFLYQ